MSQLNKTKSYTFLIKKIVYGHFPKKKKNTSQRIENNEHPKKKIKKKLKQMGKQKKLKTKGKKRKQRG